jgi:hypothetical protein
MKLNTNFLLVLSLGMSGAVPLLLLYSFIPWTGTTVPFRHILFKVLLLKI